MNILQTQPILVLALGHITKKAEQSLVSLRTVYRGTFNYLIEEFTEHVNIGIGSPSPKINEFIRQALCIEWGKLACISKTVASKKTCLAEISEENVSFIIHSYSLSGNADNSDSHFVNSFECGDNFDEKFDF